MAGTTYYSGSAADHLSRARAILDAHVTSNGTGRCLACGSPGPCWRREGAVRVFSRSLRLPLGQLAGSRLALVDARPVVPSPVPLAG